MAKPVARSKTVWFNIVTGIVGACNELAPVLDQLAGLGYGGETVAAVRGVVVLLSILGNTVLRLYTSEPVRLK
ncbi:MAG: hypothetical protein CML02_02530 [Pseudooceanicola sp.]|nr:hypothetical protein [Pseudooceanicola sp.]